MSDVSKVLEETIKKDAPDFVADKLMDKFDEEIIPYGDEKDPADPSHFRDEFRNFIKETVTESTTVTMTTEGKDKITSIKIQVGDNEKLGFGEKLDDNTTDELRIIGTIIHGIVGNYVLVTRDMTKDRDPEGRFGTAFLVPEAQYRVEALSKGWDVNKKVWNFSNFPGCPSFFEDIPLGELAEKSIKKLEGAGNN